MNHIIGEHNCEMLLELRNLKIQTNYSTVRPLLRVSVRQKT